MLPREKREQLERYLIGPDGVKSVDSRGRARPEPECDLRTCFQRDIDRVTHSKAFRRLKHKTQVFLQPEGDHYRTRLTHTLEVSRTARTIARALHLNEDLTEAIALAHDLGHTPFGHAGERALNALMPDGFKHYEQSLRVVDRLEKNHEGLNLCYETRIGILNHTHGAPDDTMEATVVRLSDRIAYMNHDLDDAMRAGIVLPEDVPVEVRTVIGTKNSQRLNNTITDLIAHSGGGVVCMSKPMQDAIRIFHAFMYDSVYLNQRAKGEEHKVMGIVESIWKHYHENPNELPADYHSIVEQDGLDRAVCDYISGMTDGYCMEVYSKLFIPAAWSVK